MLLFGVSAAYAPAYRHKKSAGNRYFFIAYRIVRMTYVTRRTARPGKKQDGKGIAGYAAGGARSETPGTGMQRLHCVASGIRTPSIPQ